MLIKACLNGGTTRHEHPAVPQTPDELAADAIAAVRAGAGAVHLHPRNAACAETLDPGAALADGRLASGNAELVEAAVSLVAVIGGLP